ncbi:hypothetical protein M407DRAFT_6216 [Tulasnella calospora MUT 4182]|uniref:SHSP domain-containing protein n=1 Tax=Tulasnella calospora MUT 4182 TaxID=1051891 RepID=A0A0C3QN42_9AGAM|nr:hypothetical protein M407DRAFT_6216 [Tulasnella calospora MUT 4182]
MRLKKNHPTLDSISASSSSSSSTVPLPPNTLRKPKPPPADALPPKEDPSASPPRQPSTLKKASLTARAMNVPSSSRSSSSSSSSSSTTTADEAEVVSLNDDADLKHEAPPSSSPTKLSQFTFRGWPVSRKPPSTFSPPPSRDGPPSTAKGNYWSSVAPTNPQSQAITPSSSAASASSPTSTSPTLPWSSADMNRASSGASTSSSAYSVKVTAPTALAIHHPELSSSTNTNPSSTIPEGDEEDRDRPITPPERRSGHFERCVQFGSDADPSRASARFDGETLVINVPKKRSWADVDIIHRNGDGSAVEPTTPVLSQEKSPRSIALALAASPTTSTSSRSERHLQLDEGGSGSGSGGGGSSAAVSPGAESTAESTTPEGEMTSGSSCTDTSSVPSPVSEDGGSPLDEVSRRLDEVHLDLRDGSDEEEGGETRRGRRERLSSFHSFHHQYATEPPTPTSFLPRQPTPFIPSYPLSPNKQNSSEPSPIASWLSNTSATLPRSRSHSPPQPYHQHGGSRKSSSGSDSDSSEGRAAARRHFGIEDDLVTPTPQRMQKRRGPSGVEQTTTATATANHHAMSPKKDYFGFPMTPVLATTSATPDAEKTTPPKTTAPSSASGFSNNHPMLKQRSPTREAGPSGASLSPSRMPLSVRRGSVTSVDEDGVEHMRISLPPSASASPNTASSVAGRTREQGMGRSAFFWKRWAPGQGS